LFGSSYAVALIDACRAAAPNGSDNDVLATVTEVTARSIALAYERFVPEPIKDILVSGGGAKNKYLMERLALHVTQCPLRAFDEVFFPGEAKEAVAFAFLGLRHLRGEPGNVPLATGARGPRVLGKRTPA
jgi:anhydro-N-acetylmuramic acid kinase